MLPSAARTVARRGGKRPDVGLDAASLGPLGIDPPPIFVGGEKDQTIAIAVDHADGWNAVVHDTKHFTELARTVDRLCARLGRQAPLSKGAQVFVRDIDISEARRLVTELESAGAHTVMFVLVDERGPAAVRRLARAVL